MYALIDPDRNQIVAGAAGTGRFNFTLDDVEDYLTTEERARCLASSAARSYKLAGGSWAYRYRDEHKRRRQKGGFATRSEALEALDDALKTARNPERARRRDWTVTELVERYLAQHQAAPATIARLTACRRRRPRRSATFGLRELLPDEIGAWAKRIPEGHRHDAMVAFRQVLNAAVRWKLIEREPGQARPQPAAAARRDPSVRVAGRRSRPSPRSWGRGGRSSSSRPVRACARRSGWRSPAATSTASAVTVERTFSGGELREYGKTSRSRRRVPLRSRVARRPRGASAEAGHAAAVPGASGRPHRPAQLARARVEARAPGGRDRPERRIYDLRHTYATFSLAAGVSLFTLSRRMGTSVEMIDRTYGHLAPDAEEYERGLLDAFDAHIPAETAEGEAR